MAPVSSLKTQSMMWWAYFNISINLPFVKLCYGIYKLFPIFARSVRVDRVYRVGLVWCFCTACFGKVVHFIAPFPPLPCCWTLIPQAVCLYTSPTRFSHLVMLGCPPVPLLHTLTLREYCMRRRSSLQDCVWADHGFQLVLCDFIGAYNVYGSAVYSRCYLHSAKSKQQLPKQCFVG